MAADKLFSTGLIVAFATATIVTASAQSNKPGASASGSDMKVAVTQPTEPMQDLRTAIRELREASVLLLNQKEQSAARDKVVNAAQMAIARAQGAMVRLPAQMRVSDADTREAKDWPAAAARLDKASLALESAIKGLEKKSSSSGNEAAITEAQEAIDNVQDALLAMPDWKPGKS